MDSASFSAEVQAIIRDGRSWGMSDAEISECLASGALGGKQSNKKTGVSNNKGTTSGSGSLCSLPCYLFGILLAIFKWCLVIPIILTISWYVLMYALTLSPDAELKFTQISTPYVYPVMRMARIALKPMADQFNIANYYSEECIIQNPLYLDPVDDCVACQGLEKIADLTKSTPTRMQRYTDDLKPFVLRGYQKQSGDFKDLQKIFGDSAQNLKQFGQVNLKSNVRGVKTATQLFQEHTYEDIVNANNGGASILWHTNSVISAQAIRKIFSRPIFVPASAEVALEKRIYIQGPLGPHVDMPMSGFANNWYVQAAGKRVLTLHPHPDCKEHCKQIQITVSKGDLVYYQDQYWRLSSSPASHEASSDGELSIGFSCSFTF